MLASKVMVVERSRGHARLAVVIEHLDGERKPEGLNSLFAFGGVVGTNTERGDEAGALEAIRQAMLDDLEAARERIDWLEAQYKALTLPPRAAQFLSQQGIFDSDLDGDEARRE